MYWLTQGLRVLQVRPGVMATQHFKINLLLNLYRKGKTYCWFVSYCCLKEIKMSGTCSLFPPFGDPWPPCLLPSQLIKAHWVLSEVANARIKLMSETQKEWKLDDILELKSTLEQKPIHLHQIVKAKKKNISSCKQVHELTYSIQNEWFNQVRQHKVTSAKKD